MELSNLFETMFSKKTTQVDYTARLQTVEPTFDQANFNTPLPAAKQIEFSNWKAINAPNDSGHDYDLQGAFLAGITRDPVTGHMDDRFKKPNHPTFSIHSQYATGKWKQYAGSWDKDTYIPAQVWSRGNK